MLAIKNNMDLAIIKKNGEVKYEKIIYMNEFDGILDYVELNKNTAPCMKKFVDYYQDIKFTNKEQKELENEFLKLIDENNEFIAD